MASSHRHPLFSFVVLLAIVGCTIASFSSATDADDFVYPYLSTGDNGAVYGQSYYIISSTRSEGGLVSEWDETNQTYYMRLTGSYTNYGSPFTLLPSNSELNGTTVYKNDTLRFASSTLNSTLTWREESENEWFLIEKSCSSEDCTSDGTNFTIVYTDSYGVLCPPVFSIHCEKYVLISAPGSYSSGLQKYEENKVYYITLGEEGSVGDLELLLVSTSSVRGQAVI